MKKFNFDAMMIMIEADTDASVAIDIATNETWRPHNANLRDCADKFAADCLATGQEPPLAYQEAGLAPDNDEEEIVIPPIVKSRSRKQRRRAEELRKERYELLWHNPSHNDTIKRINHGDKTAYIKGGDKYPWKKVWRRMNHRALREDGKRMCREYDVADFITDFSTTSVDEEVTVISEIGVPETVMPESPIKDALIPETYKNMYIVEDTYSYDFDYVTDTFIIDGYDNAIAFFSENIRDLRSDETFKLYTTYKDERGILRTDTLIAGEG